MADKEIKRPLDQELTEEQMEMVIGGVSVGENALPYFNTPYNTTGLNTTDINTSGLNITGINTSDINPYFGITPVNGSTNNSAAVQ